MLIQDDLKYQIKANELGTAAAKFFYLAPDSGIVMVRRPLNRTDPEFPASAVFLFTITATDQVPVNSKTSEASVSITVTAGGDDRPPRFDLTLYRADITENYAVNSTVVNTRATDPDGNGKVNYCFIVVFILYYFFFLEVVDKCFICLLGSFTQIFINFVLLLFALSLLTKFRI